MIRHWRLLAATLGVVTLVALGLAFAALRADHASSAKSLPSGQLISVAARLVPQSHLFGEPIRVGIDVIVDRSRVDPDLVRLHAKWTPYRLTGATRRGRRDIGSYSQLSWRLQLHCVESQCLPGLGSVRRFRFRSASITYPAGGKGTSAAAAPIVIKWPAIAAVSRLDPIDRKRQPVVSEVGHRVTNREAILPPWRADSVNLDAVSYGIRPDVLFWTSLAGALLLLAAGGWLVAPLIPTPQWLLRRRAPEPTRLERALAAYEQVRIVGGPVQQRLALELLAGELGRSGEGALAWTASELAWSQPAPPAERGAALTTDVQQAIERGSHGSNGN